MKARINGLRRSGFGAVICGLALGILTFSSFGGEPVHPPIGNPVGIPDSTKVSQTLTGNPIEAGPVEAPIPNPSGLPLFTNFPIYTGQPIGGPGDAPIANPDNLPLPDPFVVYQGEPLGPIPMTDDNAAGTGFGDLRLQLNLSPPPDECPFTGEPNESCGVGFAAQAVLHRSADIR